MKYVTMIGVALIATPVIAQTTSTDELTAACNLESGQSRYLLGSAQQQIIQLKKQLAEAEAKAASVNKEDK